MEISTKKLNNAIYRFMTKGYQYTPSEFMFDYDSDPDYVYIAVRQVYIIRVPKTDIEDTLSVKNTGSIRKYVNLERMIQTTAEAPRLIDYVMGSTETLSGGKEVVNFYPDGAEDGLRISIDCKFFSEFYNKPVTKYGVPDNITFSAIPDKKSPVIMWQDDEVIALFLPINR